MVSFSIVHKCWPMRRESMVASDVALKVGYFEFLRIHNLSFRSYLRLKFSAFTLTRMFRDMDSVHWTRSGKLHRVELLEL